MVKSQIQINNNKEMPGLDFLPDVDSFFGLDLKTGSLMIAVMGIVHPMAYGCTFFIRMSCLIVTIWILVVIFFATSVALLYGVIHENKELCLAWIYYELFFSFTMFILMLLLAILYNNRRQNSRVLVTVLGMLYYAFSNYFIVVVNSHRKRLK